MGNLANIPEWFGTARIGAIVAAPGYVAKLFLDRFRDVRNRSHNNRAKLVTLYSLQSAGDGASAVQSDKRNELYRMISKRLPSSENEIIGYIDQALRD